MANQYDQQINHAPAVSLETADYLTNKKITKEYNQIQVDHLNQPSWLGRFADRPAVRRFARDVFRLVLLLIAVTVAIALLYFLEKDASLATGKPL